MRRLPPVAQHYLVDVYLRPFARPDLPDIFSEAASLRE
jgi:hypothetical protein